MRIDAPAALRLLDVLATEWIPIGSTITSCDPSRPLPHRPTVYLLSRAGDIVYVGQTQDLKVRMAQHNANPRMVATGWDTVNWFDPGIDDLPTRLQIEAILICAFLPPKNKAVMLVKNKQNKLCEIKFGSRGALGRAMKSAASNDAGSAAPRGTTIPS